jgi:hypothetical protein
MMRPDFDPLDHLLADDAAATDIVPSAGFTDAVMDAVKRSRTALPPIPFPWRRVGPWLAAAVILVAIGAATAGPLPSPDSGVVFAVPDAIRNSLRVMATPELAWIISGLLLSIASVTLALRSDRWFGRRWPDVSHLPNRDQRIDRNHASR